APEMHGAQEQTERGLKVEIEQALICAVGGRHVDQRETDSRRDLQHEERQRRAAKDVPPARGAARDGMLENRGNCAAEPRPLLEPLQRRTDQRETFVAHTGLESVGSWAPRTQSARLLTRYSYSNSPRGGGPEAREPSS